MSPFVTPVVESCLVLRRRRSRPVGAVHVFQSTTNSTPAQRNGPGVSSTEAVRSRVVDRRDSPLSRPLGRPVLSGVGRNRRCGAADRAGGNHHQEQETDGGEHLPHLRPPRVRCVSISDFSSILEGALSNPRLTGSKEATIHRRSPANQENRFPGAIPNRRGSGRRSTNVRFAVRSFQIMDSATSRSPKAADRVSGIAGVRRCKLRPPSSFS